MQKMLAAGLLALVSGCIVTTPKAPPPEVTIAGPSPAEVGAILLDTFAAEGWILRDQTANQLVLYRHTGIIGIECRVVYTPTEGGTRVRAHAFYDTRSGRVPARDDEAVAPIRALLHQAAERLEKATPATASN